MQDAGDAVVVLDLFKTSCGACKYLMPGFLNLCKDSYSEEEPNVLFLKHNVFDDDEGEKTDLARRLRVRVRRSPLALPAMCPSTSNPRQVLLHFALLKVPQAQGICDLLRAL